MPSGFGEITHRAHQLASTGELARAQELLGAALADADPSPGNASAELTEAAGLLARVLVAQGDPHSARGWAAFAYSAASRLYGPSDQRTVATAATLAAVLHRVGSHARAARLYRDVIIELTATDGPESLRVLAAHADLATVEYARGECGLARTRLEDAWELHREVYGDGHLSGIKMLARLGAMQRDCGRFAESHEKLALARELCRVHLPADHPLAAQVGALARAAANPDHVCADGQPDAQDTAGVPTARATAPVESGPPDVPPAGAPVGPPVGPPPTGFPPPVTPAPPPPGYSPSVPPTGYPRSDPPQRSAPTGFLPPVPPEPAGPPNRFAPLETAGPPAGFAPPVPPQPAGLPPYPPAPQVPPPRLPPAPPIDSPPRWPPRHTAGDQPIRPQVPPPRMSTDRGPRAFRAGTHTSGVDGGEAEDLDPDDHWWPPETADPDPDDPDPAQASTHRSDGAPLPSAVPAVTSGGGAHREPPRARTGNLDDSAGGQLRHLPERRQPNRLPARIHRAPPQPIRRHLPIAIAGLVVVLLGTAAVIAGFALVDDPEPPPQPTVPTSAAPTSAARRSPSAPPPAAPGTPPGAVSLTDSRDSVTLSWTYPVGAEGPVVLSGGRAGQEPRPFQELPAGSTGYVVYSLETSTNYCFTVAVVYSANLMGRADPICTERAGASPAR